MVTRPQPRGIDRDITVLQTILREHGGFLGVGALVVVPGEVRAGDRLLDLGSTERRRGPGNPVAKQERSR